jgi:hypothetical protein
MPNRLKKRFLFRFIIYRFYFRKGNAKFNIVLLRRCCCSHLIYWNTFPLKIIIIIVIIIVLIVIIGTVAHRVFWPPSVFPPPLAVAHHLVIPTSFYPFPLHLSICRAVFPFSLVLPVVYTPDGNTEVQHTRIATTKADIQTF